MGVARPVRFVRFESFQLDLRTGELRRNGVKVRVPDQSVKVLAMLAENSGEVVTREELHRRLWPNGTIVEFDHSINAAIKRLRQALEDSAEEAKFIETLPRRGYRFILPVEKVESVETEASSDPEPEIGALAGQTISHYRVLNKLGQGATGVVYQAEDTTLGRPVAIKFLSEELSDDPQALERFQREARAASAVNHPNICTVHEVGEYEDVPFIVMEYVTGKSLDQLIWTQGLPMNRVLNYAVQITDALVRAHSAGIVHRDLKPANIMVSQDGLVKLLDFGLAKLAQGAPKAALSTYEANEELLTSPGAAVGTAAYMSPEQAEGKMIDARSDIFSFGSVLYEMLTGHRAFQGETKASTIAAILREDPKPPSQIVEGLPREVERIVRRCLRKDAAQRFQTMADLKVALAEAKEESDSGTLESTKATPPKRRRRLLWASVMTLLAAGVWLVRFRTAKPEASLVAVPLTTYPGTEQDPSFSPDGSQVAFSWCPDFPVPNCHIYIKQVGVEPPSRLTDNAARDYNPAWSPDGQTIAFLRDVDPSKTALMLIPQRGGRERVLEVADKSGQKQGLDGPFLAWTPDAKWIVAPALTEQQAFALTLISVETGEKRRLTNPATNSAVGDTCPAFSPDGRTLAFSRESLSGDRADLYLLHLAPGYKPEAEPEKVALDNPFNLAATWTPDGGEVVFSSGTQAGVGLWRISARKPVAPRRLALASDNANAPSVSRQENRLAYVVNRFDTNIWRVTLPTPGRKPASPVQLIASTTPDYYPSYSPDGKRIAFNSLRSGTDEIWICDADGSNLVQLTSVEGADEPRWSPDGGTIGFALVTGGKSEIYAISANGGKPRRLVASVQGQWPYWSRNGEWLYFTLIHDGRFDIAKMPAKGGAAVQITRNGGDHPEESPDGKVIYYSKGFPNHLSVWKVPVGGGEEIKVLDPVNVYGQWTVGQRGIYFFSSADKQGHSEIRFYDFATRKVQKLLTIERPVHLAIAVSPDGRTILYSQLDEAGSDLMLVENFR